MILPPRHRLLLAVASIAVLLLPATATAAGDPFVERLLRRTDDLLRGASSTGQMTMRVSTRRFDRSLTLRVWSKGTDRTLVQIVAPPKEKGMASLKVGNEIWNYLPKVDRTIKVPASMMSASWMGSHFTNDDVVKHSRFVDDYECELTSRPEDEGQERWIIECIPKPDAPVVWGKVVLSFRAVDELVDEVTYWDERDRRVRTLVYSEFGDLGGRHLPRRIRVVPADEPEEFTEIVYDDLDFDVEVPDRTFTLQALKP